LKRALAIEGNLIPKRLLNDAMVRRHLLPGLSLPPQPSDSAQLHASVLEGNRPVFSKLKIGSFINAVGVGVWTADTVLSRSRLDSGAMAVGLLKRLRFRATGFWSITSRLFVSLREGAFSDLGRRVGDAANTAGNIREKHAFSNPEGWSQRRFWDLPSTAKAANPFSRVGGQRRSDIEFPVVFAAHQPTG